MPKLSVISIALGLLHCFNAAAQHINVPSGNELVNFGVLCIRSTDGVIWSTDRSSAPGYFSAADTAAFTGCSNEVHINGYVKKYGNRPFIFPVGNGTKLMALEISAPSLPTDAYAVAWIDADPTITIDPGFPFSGLHPVTHCSLPVSLVSTIGQWDWQTGENERLGTGTTGTGEGLEIRVTLPDMRDFAATEELRLVGWNGSSWVDLSHGIKANGNMEGSVLSGTMIAGITSIGIGKVGAKTPVRNADPVNTDPLGTHFNAPKLYPNPVSSSFDQVTLEYTSNIHASARILVFNSLQQLMHVQSISVNEGMNQWKIPVSRLPRGIFFIRVQLSDGKPMGQAFKLIKN